MSELLLAFNDRSICLWIYEAHFLEQKLGIEKIKFRLYRNMQIDMHTKYITNINRIFVHAHRKIGAHMNDVTVQQRQALA